MLSQFEFDWIQIARNLGYLLAAYLLAVPIGFNREKTSHSAGIRTFPLVSIASCGYLLIGKNVFQEEVALSRVLYGVIAGMGFIGGGAILKNHDKVLGTATAASLWSTGAIGVSTALNLFEIAILLSAVNFFTFLFTDIGKKFKEKE